MAGPILIAIGLGLGLVGAILLRRSGAGWRIGRLLSAAPPRSLEEAASIAHGGQPTYIRVHGRIDSDEEFPGADGKPIVFRRRRLQQRSDRSGWKTFDDERLAVPFGLTDHGVRVAIDTEALGDGLVVVPRESVGVAADLTEEASTTPLPDLPAETPVRLRIEQVSAIDQATAAGVPALSEDGMVTLSPGLGRPLLLTTLELDEAMRILAGDRRNELLLASGLLVAAPIVVVIGLVVAVIV